MYFVSVHNSRLPNKPSLRVRAWNRVLRDMTYISLYTTLHDIIYDIGGYLLLSLLLGFYFFCLGPESLATCDGGTFPFSPKGWISLFFYFLLHWLGLYVQL